MVDYLKELNDIHKGRGKNFGNLRKEYKEGSEIAKEIHKNTGFYNQKSIDQNIISLKSEYSRERDFKARAAINDYANIFLDKAIEDKKQTRYILDRAIKILEIDNDLAEKNSVKAKLIKIAKAHPENEYVYEDIKSYLEAHSGKKKGIEGKIFSGSFILSFLVSLFFLSPNLTGNAIGNLSENSSGIISFGFFIFGLVLALVYFIRK
jgi:hypothetical protein